MNKSLGSLALLLSLASAAPRGQAQLLSNNTNHENGNNDLIGAVVDEDGGLQSEPGRAVAQGMVQYQRHPSQVPARNLLEGQVLNRLVLTRLQVAKADSTGIR